MNRARLFGVASIAGAILFAQSSAIAEYVDGNKLAGTVQVQSPVGTGFFAGDTYWLSRMLNYSRTHLKTFVCPAA